MPSKVDATTTAKSGGNTRAEKYLPSEPCCRSPEWIAEVCRVSKRTAQNYIKKGKAPYAIAKLLDLTVRGRILPESWNHCFINHRENIEIYQVGEVSENQFVSMRWKDQLNQDYIRTLKRGLAESHKRIEQLEKYLEEARAELGQMPAANDPPRKPF